MKKLRIALAQTNPTVGDLAGNAAGIVKLLSKAQRSGAELIVFGELAVCGYPPEDLLLKKSFLKDSYETVKKLAGQCADIPVIVGFAEPTNQGCCNSAAVLVDGKIAGVYRKVHLPNYGVFDEQRYFMPGDESTILQINGHDLAVTICEDIWANEYLSDLLSKTGPIQGLINLSASPFHAGKMSVRQKLLANRARQLAGPVCYVNLVGGQDEVVFDGGSMIVEASGKVLAAGRRFGEDLLVVDLALPEAADKKAPAVARVNRIVIQSPQPVSKPKMAAEPTAELNDLQEIYEALVLGTRDFVRKNGFSKVVLGLSGGIDSALVAVIAVEALGAENVTAVTMPSKYSSDETRSDAERMARNLGIKLITVGIQQVFDNYLQVLKDAYGEGPAGLENENLQARIRGNILMALSNRFGWLVLATGNKSETAVGYCTLYGDMVGGFAVIKDVFKTTVYKLAEYVNSKAEREVIPASTIERAPSAELRPDQKDEDSLPPYDLLDAILKLYVEEDKHLDEIVAEGLDVEATRQIIRLVDRNEFKRRQAAPGIKITPKAFGRDRRLPITNRYG
ncbi:MAG: NAD+ synthase [Actinobacteria bacterium]|nr:NAD+ synthase [Actinomycetota bacterium]